MPWDWRIKLHLVILVTLLLIRVLGSFILSYFAIFDFPILLLFSVPALLVEIFFWKTGNAHTPVWGRCLWTLGLVPIVVPWMYAFVGCVLYTPVMLYAGLVSTPDSLPSHFQWRSSEMNGVRIPFGARYTLRNDRQLSSVSAWSPVIINGVAWTGDLRFSENGTLTEGKLVRETEIGGVWCEPKTGVSLSEGDPHRVVRCTLGRPLQAQGYTWPVGTELSRPPGGLEEFTAYELPKKREPMRFGQFILPPYPEMRVLIRNRDNRLLGTYTPVLNLSRDETIEAAGGLRLRSLQLTDKGLEGELFEDTVVNGQPRKANEKVLFVE